MWEVFKKNILYMEKNADKLTILIPSRNRLKELSSLLSYFQAKRVKNKIIILESGNNYQSITSKFNKLDIDFHYFDDDISPSAKFLVGAALIKTDLVCICTDDDLVLKDGIDQCADFLIQNPEYSACQGYHALFEMHHEDINLLDILWFTPSIDHDQPIKRLHSLITRYQPICWAIFRRDAYLKIAQNFNEVTSPLFFELVWSSLAALSGKIKRLPVVYCLRKRADINVFGHPQYLFIESPDLFIKEYYSYRDCIIKFLNIVQNENETRKTIDLIHAYLFYNGLNPEVLRFISTHAIENPKFSILDPNIMSVIKCHLPAFEENNSQLVTGKKRKYRIAAKFIHPQPKEEIYLPDDYYLSILKELEYF